jgi:hypothetical protein
MKKLLVVGVIGLFLGLAVAPSINANVSKESELVEITTEICGLDGGKHTVQLTKEEAEEVDRLFENIRLQLNESNSREEVNRIFKEVVVKLDKYGLLGGLSVKQVQRLAMERYQDSKEFKISDTLRSRLQKNTSNFLCLIAGYTNGTNFDSQLELFCVRIAFLLSFIGPIFFNKFHLYTSIFFLYLILNTINPFNPISIVSRINLGGEKGGGWFPEFEEYYAHGWLHTTGVFGIKKCEGLFIGTIPLRETAIISNGFMFIFNPGVIGFTGLHIYNPSTTSHFYLGSALLVNLKEV